MAVGDGFGVEDTLGVAEAFGVGEGVTVGPMTAVVEGGGEAVPTGLNEGRTDAEGLGLCMRPEGTGVIPGAGFGAHAPKHMPEKKAVANKVDTK